MVSPSKLLNLNSPMPYKHYEMRMPAITKKLFFGEFWMFECYSMSYCKQNYMIGQEGPFRPIKLLKVYEKFSKVLYKTVWEGNVALLMLFPSLSLHFFYI